MDKEEYYKRIEKINNRFKTDRVSADEEYQLVCQKNYLSTKYIEHLEQQCKKQKEVIDKAIEYINKYAWQEDIIGGIYTTNGKPATDRYMKLEWDNCNELLDILKEVE